jgi:hypothetical protein
MTISLWLLFVAACVVAGASVGTKSLTNAETGVGESARADAIVAEAHLTRPAQENILVQSTSAAGAQSAVGALERKLHAVAQVAAIHGPNDTPALSRAGGPVWCRSRCEAIPTRQATTSEVYRRLSPRSARGHPRVPLQEVGDGTIDKAFNTAAGTDLQRAELFSLPITLLILVLAFAALVAACVPLPLGVGSVVAALGAEGRTNAAIARTIVVTPGAVEKHISNIFAKLSLPATDDDHRRVLAVLAFLQAQ